MTDAALDVAAQFEGARLVVIGGTGFLGKVFLALLLDRYPSLGTVFLMVRARGDRDPEARFWSEVTASPVFDPLRSKYPGAAFEDFLRAKVAVFDGDVSQPACGVDPNLLADLEGTVDAVVNVAGVVDFNPPLDEAMAANALGVHHLADLARALGEAPVLHTSTCYVAGYRAGVIDERDPRDHPFPRADALDATDWDPQREIHQGIDLARELRQRAEGDAFRASALREEVTGRLTRRREPTDAETVERELERARKRWVDDQLATLGMQRAKHWGWPNTYTYTKAIGEQVLARSGLPFTLVRPSVIESSVRYPCTGWNEGINTTAPVIYMAMKGHHQVPGGPKTGLDVIPVDLVAVGMIGALAALLQGTHRPVYQLASSDLNYLSMHRIIELVGLYKRKHYQRSGKGNPLLNALQARFECVPVSASEYQQHGAPALASAARGLAGFLKKQGAALPLVGAASRALDGYASVAQRSADILDLFLPFMAGTEYRFQCGNIREACARMPEADRAKLAWDPEKIDWRHYWHEVHIPGLEKWVMPQIDERAERPVRAMRPFASLLDLLDEAAARFEHATALARFERDGLAPVTYREWRDRARATAARLALAGVRPGDRVLLAAANHPDWAVAYFGVLRAGAVAVPVDAAHPTATLTHLLHASDARAVLWDEAVAARAEADVMAAIPSLPRLLLAHATAEDPALAPPDVPAMATGTLASIIYTSGTTATPKGVMLTHGNFTSLLGALAPVFPLTEGDRVLSVLPLHHTFEFTCGLLLPLSRGARVVYLDELSAERLGEAMRASRVTAMVGVPALWQLLERRIVGQVRDRGPAAATLFDTARALNRTLGRKVGVDVGRVLFGPVHGALGGHVRWLISGGAALPHGTAELFESLGLPIAEGYGLTEAAPVLTVNRPGRGARVGSVGAAVPGVEVRIDRPDAQGVGEVVARGPNVMAGYADDPEATAAAIDREGWLHTGDLGTIDEKGRLTILGRRKEVVVAANGENVYPDDVERAIGAVDGVEDVVIVGIDDPRGGERVACLAVPKRADEGADPRAARDAAMARLRAAIAKLPASQRPSVVLPYEAELPRTATRKVKRSEVRVIVERLVTASRPPPPASDGHATSAVRSAVAAIARRRPEELAATTKLRADLGFDSLMAMELSVALEAAHDGRKLPEVLAAVETIGELEAALGELPAEPARAATATVEPAEEVVPALPGAVKNVAKAALGLLQREFYGSVMRPRVTGRAFIPHNRNTIVVANHASHLDMGFVKYALGSYGRDLVTLAARDYFFEGPAFQRAFVENLTNLVPFDRTATGLRQALREAGRLLDEGNTVLIFPEGTRSPDGGIKEFRPAVGHLALQHDVDVLPVFVGGTYDALPRSSVVPRRRDLVARIGPPLTAAQIRARVAGLKHGDAARMVAALAQRAVEALRDGDVLDLDREPADVALPARAHPLVTLFGELEQRFVPGTVDSPVSFYFSLGGDDDAKWTVKVEPTRCEVIRGKAANGHADCVLKTSAEIFTRIVREGYEPGVPEFLSGAVKSNDVTLLKTFQRAFQLG